MLPFPLLRHQNFPELWAFNVSARTWSVLNTAASIPAWGHASLIIPAPSENPFNISGDVLVSWNLSKSVSASSGFRNHNAVRVLKHHVDACFFAQNGSNWPKHKGSGSFVKVCVLSVFRRS